MTRIASLVILVGIYGCGATTPPTATSLPQSPTAPSSAPMGSADLAARAEQALHEDAPIDYARPFDDKPSSRDNTAALWRSACRQGNKRACQVAATVTGQADADLAAVVANCLNGDAMSCHAIPPDNGAPRFPNAPGAASRSRACNASPPTGCDVATLRSECSAGFPRGCLLLAIVEPPADGKTLTMRTHELDVRDCREGILESCLYAAQLGSADEQIEMWQRACDLDRFHCSDLAMSYEDAHRDSNMARDAAERSCEYGRDRWSACIFLATRYRSHMYEEPVPGRAQKLLDWACPQAAQKVKSPYFEKHFPACVPNSGSAAVISPSMP